MADVYKRQTLTIETDIGSIVFAGSASQYEDFLFPANEMCIRDRSCACFSASCTLDCASSLLFAVSSYCCTANS